MVRIGSKKTVVFIIPTLHYGGAERVLHEIVDNLNPRYFDCHIIMLKRSAEKAYEFKHCTKLHYLDGYDRTTAKKNPDLRAVAVFKKIVTLRRLLNSFPNDTILVPFLARPTTAYTVLAQLGSGRRIFASMHTTESEYIKFNYQSGLKRLLEVLLLKIACRGSDKIVAASKGVKADLVNNFSVPAANITVIDNPLDLAKITRMKAKKPACSWAYSSTKRIFVHIGRLSVEKNHKLLIQAVAILKDSTLDFVVLIAGAGDQEKKIRRWIQEAALEDRVIMLGSVDNPYALMSRARALVLTSHYDSSPMVLKEAMASGTAVISVDCPHGPADILKDGKYGVLVSPNDPEALAGAMLNIANDEGLFAHLVQSGLEGARRYDIGNIIDQWQRLLLEVG